VYHSNRLATQYPSCTPNQICDPLVHTMRLRATQPGISGGLGTRVFVGRLPVLIDIRMHFASRTTPTSESSNDYFLMPLTFELRL
jgi:hypothetical protein